MSTTRFALSPELTRARTRYLSLAVGTAALGWASRRYGRHLPAWVTLYAGDALWALMVYWLIGSAWVGARAERRAAAAWLLAAGIEVSQLYHAPWLDAVRRTTLGALVLGRGFLWSDIGCYTLGVAAGYALKWWMRAGGAPPARN